MNKVLLVEIDTIYADEKDRFIVSLIVGYSEDDLSGESPGEVSDITPQQAAAQALDLTRDEGARGTHWFVYDRKERQMFMLEQSEFDGEMEGFRAESRDFAPTP